MLRLTFLGTSAAQPTIHRNLTGLAVRRERELFLVDCGEGTQRQMMRFGTGFSLRDIFFTHLHADHDAVERGEGLLHLQPAQAAPARRVPAVGVLDHQPLVAPRSSLGELRSDLV